MNRREVFFAGAAATMLTSDRALAANMGAEANGKGAATTFLSVMDFGAKGDGVTDDTAAIQSALDQTFSNNDGQVLIIPPGVYLIGQTLKVDLRKRGKSHPTRQTVIRAHGATFYSAIDNGRNVFEIESHATARYLLIDGLSIQGRGNEGHGLYLDCNREGSYLYNFCLRDLVIQGCGGDGLRMIGNVFEGQIFNSYFRDNKGSGATMGHGPDGGVLSAIHVFGCVFGGNGNDGAALINNAADVSFHGSYFLLNGDFGVSAKNGCTLLSNCGFENNHRNAEDFEHGDAGINLQVFGTLVGCTAYSIYKQTHLIRGFITNHLVMVGCTAAGGGGAKKAKLAKLQSNGRGKATIIGCQGAIETIGPFEPVRFGEDDAGATFGSRWNSDSGIRLGDYSLWVDADGKLRMKNGRPNSDADGKPIGA